MDKGMARAQEEVLERWPDKNKYERKKLTALVRRRNFLGEVLEEREDHWDKAEHAALTWALGQL